MFDLYLKFKEFWPIIKIFLWVFAILLGIEFFQIGLDYLADWLEKRRIKKWLEKHKTLEEWKKVDGRKFEEIVAIIFRNLGYKVKITGGPRDLGVDLITIKEGKRYFIQCKNIEKVLPNQIREFYGSVVDRLKQGEKGFFITTGEFTEECKDFARNKPIELIDGIKLEKLANP